MLQTLLDNSYKYIQYGLLLLAYTLVDAYVFNWLLPIPFWQILLDSLFHGLLFAILALLLWKVFKYGNFAVLTVFQRTLNHIALALISLAIWVGIGYMLVNWFLGIDVATLLIPFLPVRAFIGMLIYLILIQRFNFNLYHAGEFAEESDVVVQQIEVEQNPSVKTELLERIAVKTGTKIHVVLVSEIIFLQADGDYVQIFTMQGKYLKEQTMKFFEEHLPGNQFVRVHRSCIVNIEMISRIELYEKQNQLLTLKNGQQIKTSPAGYKALRLALKL
jgi:hypothetical protein